MAHIQDPTERAAALKKLKRQAKLSGSTAAVAKAEAVGWVGCLLLTFFTFYSPLPPQSEEQTQVRAAVEKKATPAEKKTLKSPRGSASAVSGASAIHSRQPSSYPCPCPSPQPPASCAPPPPPPRTTRTTMPCLRKPRPSCPSTRRLWAT